MDLGLSGKVAIVTGASRGIGRAEALVLGREGADVVVVFKTSSRAAEEVAADIRAMGRRALAIGADVSSSLDVQAMVSRTLQTLGKIDILVNNAGVSGKQVGSGKCIVDLEEEDWHAMLSVHLTGTFLCTKYVAPSMINRHWGRIVNTSSILGRVGGRPGAASYGAAKAAIIAFTKSAAIELAPHGITVNAVAPGYIETAHLKSIMSPEFMEFARKQTPLGRFAQPEELADLVVFLASDKAGFLTGAIIDFHGGRMEYYAP